MPTNDTTPPLNPVGWTFAEAFPLIAQVIPSIPGDVNGFRSTAAIAEGLLSWAPGLHLVKAAKVKSGSAETERTIAANMIAWFSQQISVKKSPWTNSFDRSQGPAYLYRPIDEAAPGPDPELEAYEGDKRYVVHLQTERNPAIVQAKRESARAPNGGLTCEACGANSVATFPGVQGDIWEVHHRLPLSEAKQQVVIKLQDLAILCPTCHRAIHSTRPFQTVEQFGANFFPVHALPSVPPTSD